jgi:hypothetical protein
VLFDPARLAGYGLSLADLRRSLQAANAQLTLGALVGDNREIPVQAGSFLVDAAEMGNWWWDCTKGRRCIWPMSPKVNRVRIQPGRYVWLGTGPAAAPAVFKVKGRVSRRDAGDRQKARRKRGAPLPTSYYSGSNSLKEPSFPKASTSP